MVFTGVALLTGAARADVGTCLTVGGVQVGPWTDDSDPACGADCGAEGIDVTCDADTCLDAGDEIGPMNFPAAYRAVERVDVPDPQGPRCFEPGPVCGDGSPNGLVGATDGFLVGPHRFYGELRRRPGSLPGAGVFWAQPSARSVPGRVDTRPPR
jgi:hypothetical protein